jgi:AcrR family transcriptional regulator
MVKAARLTREEQAAASRRAILDAALLLFAEHGFAGTSTRKIAKKAEVSEGLIFHHFPTKQDVLRSIVESRQTMPAMVRSLLSDNPDLPVRDFVETVTRGFVTLLRPGQPESRLFRVMLGEAHRNAELYAFAQGVQTMLIETLRAYFEGRIGAGEIRPDLEPSSAARTLMGGLVLFFLLNHRLAPEEWDVQAAAHARGVADLWLRGALASTEDT